MGDNLRLLQAEQLAHRGRVVNDKLIEYLQRRIKNNNNLIKLDEAMTGESNGIDVVYHRKENGRYIKTTMRFPSEDMAPPKANRGKQVWTRGDVGPKDDAGSRGSGSDKDGLTQTKKMQAAVDDYFDLRAKIHAMENKDQQNSYIMNKIGTTKGPEAESLKALLEDATKEQIEEQKAKLASMERLWGGYKFFQDAMKDASQKFKYEKDVLDKAQNKVSDKERIKSKKGTKKNELGYDYDIFGILDD
jgi:hypothetical protein